MKIRIEWLTGKTCAVTLIPSWLGRLFGAETRRGIAYQGTYDEPIEDEDGNETDEVYVHTVYYWKTTRRYVGWRVMRAIEAAPLELVEDMSVERLLIEDSKPR
jgi:hypothetical protein